MKNRIVFILAFALLFFACEKDEAIRPVAPSTLSSAIEMNTKPLGSPYPIYLLGDSSRIRKNENPITITGIYGAKNIQKIRLFYAVELGDSALFLECNFDKQESNTNRLTSLLPEKREALQFRLWLEDKDSVFLSEIAVNKFSLFQSRFVEDKIQVSEVSSAYPMFRFKIQSAENQMLWLLQNDAKEVIMGFYNAYSEEAFRFYNPPYEAFLLFPEIQNPILNTQKKFGAYLYEIDSENYVVERGYVAF
jgi:hypothetical protein